MMKKLLNTRILQQDAHSLFRKDLAFKIAFSSNFYITRQMIPIAGALSAVSHIFFYFLCTTILGYKESLLLRLLVTVTTLPLIFYNPKNEPSTALKIYFEIVVAYSSIFVFTYLFLLNEANTYWFVSYVWMGFAYGFITSKVTLAVLGYPIFVILSTFIGRSINPSLPPLFPIGIEAVAISLLSSILSGASKFAINLFYLRALETKTAEVKAAEAEERRQILEAKNDELMARNAIISTFVRPSLLKEINLGRDPRTFAPQLKDTAILICDMRNFTPLTATMNDANVQAEFLNKYFEMMIQPVFSCGGEVDKLMGDAIMAIFPNGKAAIYAALKMRERLQIYNRELVTAGMKKIANVITMSKGQTLEANIGSLQKLDRTWIGNAVNICARLESIAKLYGVEVIATKNIVDDLPGYPAKRKIDIIKVKGFDRKIEIFEIFGHQPDTVIKYKRNHDTELSDAINKYFTKGQMKEAYAIFKNMLQSMPKHSHIPDKFMDNIVHYYLVRCERWLNNRELREGSGLNLTEGFHDFSTDMMPRNWYEVPAPEVLSNIANAPPQSRIQASPVTNSDYAQNRTESPDD